MRHELIPGSTFDLTHVLRSIDWTTNTATCEDTSKPFCFYQMSFRSLPVDRDYARETLDRLYYFASLRTTGKHKVSKACVKRLQAQLAAI
jgi:hypothetical protein